MSSNDPEQIRREIDATRSSLSYDVNALADEARPSSVARRQVRKVQSSAWSLRERLFGSDDETEYAGMYDPDYYRAAAGYQTRDEGDMTRQVREGVSGMTDTVRDTAHTVRDTAADAPRQVRRRTQGAPLTLGLIAFGVGGLVAALLPASDKERQAAVALKDQAGPLVDEAKAVAQESMERIKPAAKDAVGSVQETARSGAQAVKQDAQDSAQVVRDQASQAKDQVRGDPGDQPASF